ncbi:thiopeptide-type bacteriocin biosynthesis domain-containing protein [Chitinophaga sp. CF118]|uniref:lantibiotic dehydratase n=1 Tax=Chitinophaga sp. CF118 TaxID=1884367 RepID=UPI0008EC6134|nr:lantibiotic dehydratase [Chitinophaga sp. CF118]SFF04022.1 thiopeptide-type bacteriocin biosynthesis domain-containing protein [Chitinophaga sp. CF118]
MKYAFFPTLIVRNPVFSFLDYPSFDGQQLLADNFFRAALYIASLDFYNELEKRAFDYNKLSTAQKNTLQKYYNRACFRPTPFGAFSSLTGIEWSNNDTVLLNEHVKAHLKLDYHSSLELSERLIHQEAKNILPYKSNTSLYKISKHLRYIRHDLDSQKLQRSFSIVSLSKNKIIEEIVQFCSTGKPLPEIAQLLQERTGYDNNIVESLLQQLIAEQIIQPQWGTNITGNDGLQALVKQLSDQGVKSDRLEHIETMLDGLHTADIKDFESILAYKKQLDGLLDDPEKRKNAFYVVTERERTTGGMNIKYQQAILEGLKCLDKLIPYHPSNELENFKKDFIRKFENREIPLLVALDPEVGIGYENQEDVVFGEDVLLKGIQFDGNHSSKEKYLKWTTGHALLLNKLQQQHADPDLSEIVLTEEDLSQITPSADYHLPPSLSVVFKTYNDLIQLESAGGVTATALLGRFSAFNEQFLSMATTIADKEQTVNDKVIFAEISHVCDFHAANINRRQHIRKYEIPVVVTSTLNDNAQVTLSDLFISVKNDQIILRSEKHNAIVIPRLSSAFNHTNSDLSVFRFLCDLQYQGLKTNFKFELNNFFPGLKFYPRVMYKSVILSLATWHLKDNDFAFLKQNDSTLWYGEFLQLARLIKLPRHFALTQHDNHLVFDRDNGKEVLLFLDAIKNNKELVLTEFLITDDNKTTVTDHQQKPMIGQYIASLYLNEPVYNMPGSVRFEESKTVSRNFVPGTEWLYLKIYCHPVGANDLLSNVLLPMLNRIFKKKIIDKWFYIRYADPDCHIRLRLHVSSYASDELIAMFSRKLKTLLDEQKIEKYYIDTYVRELERYAPAAIEDVETFFFSSSLLTLHYIDKLMRCGNQSSFRLDIIILSMEEILNAFKLNTREKASLFYQLHSSFYREFGEDKNLKKSLEKKYNETRREMSDIYENREEIKEGLDKYFLQFYRSSKTIADKVRKKHASGLPKLAADMIHMHLNRLFERNARRQEFITYYLLYKHYNAALYRSQLAG